MNVIAYSLKDIAGVNIAKILINKFGFVKTGEKHESIQVYEKDGVKLVGFSDSLLFVEEIPFNPDVCIVASRHRSEMKTPTLTCHVTGNYDKADFGGVERTLNPAPALHLSHGLSLIRENARLAGLNFEVSFEVSHHGPTINTPLLFMEVGSTRREWENQVACEVVAKSILELAMREPPNIPVGIGFGGTHYAPNFSKLRDVAMGHIMPKYFCEKLDEDIFFEMFNKTLPEPEYCVIDWKGLKGADKKKVLGLAKKYHLEVKKTSDLKG